MKANASKCHLLLSTDDKLEAHIGNTPIKNKKGEKLLGITIDYNMYTRASQKLNALPRVSPYMSTDKKRTLFKAFISSQFGYCPLVWMFLRRVLNN